MQKSELYLRLIRVREPRSLGASAWIHGLAFDHDGAIAAEGRNAERGKGVVFATDHECVRGGGEEAERERLLLLAGEQQALTVLRA